MHDSSPSRSGMTRVNEGSQFYPKMQSTRLSTSEITQINHTYLNSPASEHCHKFDRFSFSVRRRTWPAVYQLAHRRNFVCDDGDLSPPIFSKWKIKNTNFSLYFGQEKRIFLATRSVLWCKICRKCDSGAGGAHDAPPDPLVGWGANTLPIPHPPRCPCPPDTKSWRRHCLVYEPTEPTSCWLYRVK